MSSTPADRPRVALIILDGWGLRPPADDNAISLGRTPSWDRIWEKPAIPHSVLATSGPAVGLPEGQMGNSEVGHLNLGAGRVVVQSLLRISQAIAADELSDNPALRDALDTVHDRGSTLHLVGLVGPGGVHAADEHLDALAELAKECGLPRICLHAFLDGRDTPPSSALGYLRELEKRGTVDERCPIATISGRYYAMDRDRRWDRTELAYRAMVEGEGDAVRDPIRALEQAYEEGETDEFVRPRVVVDEEGKPVGRIRDGDAIVCFNFRADRMRQITRALGDPDFTAFDRGEGPPDTRIVTLTEYDRTLPLEVAFPPEPLDNLLCDVLAAHGRTSFRTAETEKYPHVTYFFNGGREDPPIGEERKLVPSPKVATYDLQPEMSAPEVTDGLVEAIRSREFDLLVCNYANPDMVGHTGVISAAVRAVETVDECLGRVLEACEETGTTALVTADHGNCEQMYDPETGGPHTAHTTNPVGIVLVEPEARRTTDRLEEGALADIAPTLLGLLDLPKPAEMDGRDLRAAVSGEQSPG